MLLSTKYNELIIQGNTKSAAEWAVSIIFYATGNTA